MAKKKKRKRATPIKPAQNGQQVKRLTEVEGLRVENAQLQCALAQKALETVLSRVDGIQDGDGLTKLEDGTWALVREVKADATPAPAES